MRLKCRDSSSLISEHPCLKQYRVFVILKYLTFLPEYIFPCSNAYDYLVLVVTRLLKLGVMK